MKKYALVIGATLLAGSLGWGAYEHQQSNDSETKINQYESYLSSYVTNNNAKLYANIQTASSYVDNVIETKTINANDRSMVVGQLFELMDIVQQSEHLAVATEVFENKAPSYQTANNLYFIGMYLSNLEPSTSLSSDDIEKLQTIQSFTTAWKKVANKHLSQLTTEEGFNEYVDKYANSMMSESLWEDVINDIDKETSKVLKEQKVESLETHLFPKSEEKSE